MAPLTQEVVNLIGLACGAGLAVVLTAILMAALLARQLRWFGYDGLRGNDDQ